MPGQTARPPRRHRSPSPFNGGPSNCPAKHPQRPSSTPACWATFNGGPSNCPAKPGVQTTGEFTSVDLQWRAEQLPGQTRGYGPHPQRRPDPFNGGPSNCPAKPKPKPLGERRSDAFNRGPSNCPAKRCGVREGRCEGAPLQWRAEQLPGQTRRGAPSSCPDGSFNGGPSNCPAKPCRPAPTPDDIPSFNGGPSNCPAKPLTDAMKPVVEAALQWRAEQLPRQTTIPFRAAS